MTPNPSTWTVAVDPGLRGCGIAIYENALLHCAWYCRTNNQTDRGPKAWVAMAACIEREWIVRVPRRVTNLQAIVLEVPQVYRGPRTPNPDDLIQLAGVVGAVAFGLPSAEKIHFLPREWKGQIKKEIHHPRILQKLSDAEKSGIEKTATSLVHNVYDAIGIGLFHLKRG